MKQSIDTPFSLEREAFLLVREALSPGASVRAAQQSRGPDAVIQLQGGEEIPLEFVLWTKADQADRADSPKVWILSQATTALRDRLRRQQENYVDLRGDVFLSFPNLLVDRVGLKPPSRSKAAPRSFDPFADRSSLVARTLLQRNGGADRTWGVRELAAAAGVGPATVTRTVRALQRYEVVHVRRSGRESEIRLTDPRALFRLWTAAYDWTKNQSVAVNAPIGDPTRFLRRSKDLFGPRRWALTVHAGASLVAPHATWERLHAYVDVETTDALFEIAERQAWPVGDDGRLVLMKPYYRDSVWHGMRQVQDLPVVSDLQLALDLWHYPLRGREQAEHIIRTRRLLE